MKVLQNQELEYKYSAVDISLESFLQWATKLGPSKSLYVCGYDHFFSSSKDPNTFMRHRVGADFNQLTVKRKLTENNNFLRDEINITLGKDVTTDTAAAMAKAMGFEFNTTIFKTVFVYDYTDFTLSYYTVMDSNLKEKGRFFEIEMSETHHWDCDEDAWKRLQELETQAKAALGVSAQARIKKSLYEQFRKEVK